jgi:hypothetical protein
MMAGNTRFAVFAGKRYKVRASGCLTQTADLNKGGCYLDMEGGRNEVNDRSTSDNPKRVRLPKNHEKYAGSNDEGGHCTRHSIMRQWHGGSN